jgi:hypothetical protein
LSRERGQHTEGEPQEINKLPGRKRSQTQKYRSCPPPLHDQEKQIIDPESHLCSPSSINLRNDLPRSPICAPFNFRVRGSNCADVEILAKLGIPDLIAPLAPIVGRTVNFDHYAMP